VDETGQELLTEAIESGRVLSRLLRSADVSLGQTRYATVDGCVPRHGESGAGSLPTDYDDHSAVRFLSTFLDDPLHLAVVQHPFAAPSDGWIAESSKHIVTCENSVYLVATNGERDALNAYHDGNLMPGAIGLLTSCTAPLKRGGPISSDTMLALVRAAVGLVVAAWDTEGWLYYELLHATEAVV
jgi:hypothetical protein